MKRERKFENTIIAVAADGIPFVVKGEDDLIKYLDGCWIEDNTQSLDKYPSKPGVYRCTIEFWFEKGTFEGWDAPGESEWDFIPVEIEEIPLTKQLVANG